MLVGPNGGVKLPEQGRVGQETQCTEPTGDCNRHATILGWETA